MARLFVISAPRSRFTPEQLAKTKLSPWERLVSAEITSNGAELVVRTEDIEPDPEPVAADPVKESVAEVEAAPEPAPKKKPGRPRKSKAKKAAE